MNDPVIRVEAEASGHARQANLGQGTMHVHMGDDRPELALFTLIAPPDLVGREREIADLIAQIQAAREKGRPMLVSAVHGMAGVGKCALSRAVAAAIGAGFPDARLEVERSGCTPVDEPRGA